LGSVTNDAQTKAAVVPNTAPSAGQILVGNAGGTAYAPVSMSSDATLASTGALSLRSGLNVRSCEVVIGGTGTNGVLQDTDDWAADCKNKWGVTFTITAVECYADAGSPTVMVAVSSGSNVLSGNLTCGTASWASGTLNGTPTLASNGTLDFNVVSAGGTAKIIRVLVTGTI
jgi:hypothetical protein